MRPSLWEIWNLCSWPSPIHVILNSPYYVSNLCIEDNLSLMLGPLYLKAALDTIIQYRVMTLQLCFLTDSPALKRESKTDTDLPHKKQKLQ